MNELLSLKNIHIYIEIFCTWIILRLFFHQWTNLLFAELVQSNIALSFSQFETPPLISIGPYLLDENGISNVTTQISTAAYLPCKVSAMKFFYLISSYFYKIITEKNIKKRPLMNCLTREKFQINLFIVFIPALWEQNVLI